MLYPWYRLSKVTNVLIQYLNIFLRLSLNTNLYQETNPNLIPSFNFSDYFATNLLTGFNTLPYWLLFWLSLGWIWLGISFTVTSGWMNLRSSSLVFAGTTWRCLLFRSRSFVMYDRFSTFFSTGAGADQFFCAVARSLTIVPEWIEGSSLAPCVLL